MLALPRQATYDLVWRPYPQELDRYSLNLEATVDGSKLDYSAELVARIVKIDKNGDYTVSTAFRGQRVTLDGVSQTIPGDVDSKPETERFNAHGDRLTDANGEGADGSEGALGKTLADLTEFRAPAAPAKVGDKWAKVIAGNAKRNESPARIEYVLTGLDKASGREVIKVTFTYNETQTEKPVRASGYFWIDPANGSLVRLNASISNLRLEDGGEALGQAQLDLLRK